MNWIGIENATYDVYESSAGCWHSVWPSVPVVSVAALVAPGQDSIKFETDLHRAEFVFREDSFDPVTRIRRGRFYQSVGTRQGTATSIRPSSNMDSTGGAALKSRK